MDSEQLVIGCNFFDKCRIGIRCRIGGVKPSNVGQQNQNVCTDIVRNKSCNAIVVAKTYFVAGNGVVLVDDWHATKLYQPNKCASCMQVLRAIDEVVRHQQHLGSD